MYTIPLSATPIDVSGLNGVLRRYEGKPIMQIVEDFEASLRNFTGTRYVLALNSGTSAIHLALKALGVGQGDCVVAPTFTYVATINPIIYLGAFPVFIDSESQTWNMDPALLEQAIKTKIKEGSKPKCVIVVHSYGMPAKMDELMEICDRYEIPILEDSAEAIGSTYKNAKAGTLGKVGIYSFNNNKIVTTYGGGALFTNDEEIYKNSLFWATQSREDKPFYEHSEVGFNYRMGPLNAAAGLVTMGELESKVQIRRQLYNLYVEHLVKEGIHAIWPEEGQGIFTNRWLSTPLLNGLNINQLIGQFKDSRIECRRLWNPMHLQPFYKSYLAYKNGVSEQLFEQGICLPSTNLTDAQDVVKALAHIFKGY